MSSLDWPYAEDGVQRDAFAESLRIPLVDNPYPGWRYITAVVVSPADSIMGWRGVRPTDAELRVVSSFHEEYCTHWYRQSWRDRMGQRPFDIDGAANGRILIKYPRGGWGYRHASWTYGPCLVPGPFDAPLSLLRVLDREQSLGPEYPSESWHRWVADHAEVFEAVAS